jgi:hypothetical protein
MGCNALASNNHGITATWQNACKCYGDVAFVCSARQHDIWKEYYHVDCGMDVTEMWNNCNCNTVYFGVIIRGFCTREIVMVCRFVLLCYDLADL